MIVDTKTASAVSQPGTGPSTSRLTPPPGFDEVSAHATIDVEEFETDALVIPGHEGPPPPFASYEAECIMQSNGSVVSHDPHINEDGEALYRFLLSQSLVPPSYILHCKGTHTETRIETIRSDEDDTSRENRTDHTVTDFEFSIDLGQHLVHARPVQWSVADGEPAYRGGLSCEIDEAVLRRRPARSEEQKQAKRWRKEMAARGLPPWASPGNILAAAGATADHADTGPDMAQKSSRTVRRWADEFCASDKQLKEFAYQKVVYGWNTGALEAAIRAAIMSTSYTGRISINFETSGPVYVRPDNALSRALTNKWIKLLLILTFIYPFIWLFKRFHGQGGGRWEVCGAAYALKQWEPANEELDEHGIALPRSPDVKTGAAEPSSDTTSRKLVGVREGEWFKDWESSIRLLVVKRKRETEPYGTPPYKNWKQIAANLDGYVP